MKFKIDLSKVVTSIFIAAILGGSITFFDYLSLRAMVRDDHDKISVMAKIMCQYAVNTKIKQADTICVSILD